MELTTQQLAEELNVTSRTVLQALHSIWGEEEEPDDVVVPDSLVPIETTSLVAQTAASLAKAPVQDLRVISYQNRAKKNFGRFQSRIERPSKRRYRDASNRTHDTYVFDERQANLVRALVVPNRVEVVKALAVMQAQIQTYEYSLKTLLLAYDKTAESVIDTHRTLEFAKAANVLYEQELAKRKQVQSANRRMRSALQSVLDELDDSIAASSEEKARIDKEYAEILQRIQEGA